jgi:hypothetical protein
MDGHKKSGRKINCGLPKVQFGVEFLRGIERGPVAPNFEAGRDRFICRE